MYNIIVSGGVVGTRGNNFCRENITTVWKKYKSGDSNSNPDHLHKFKKSSIMYSMGIE